MLKGINSLLHADLLHVLRAMGHQDRLAIVDGNFPAASKARRLIRVDGASSATVLAAVLELLPVDEGDEPSIIVMDAPPPEPAALVDMSETLSTHGHTIGARVAPAEFYAIAESCSAVVQTGETRPYGNVVVRKGFILTE